MDSPRPNVRVSTGARIHFGLMNTRVPFGGVGLMIDQPQTVVRVSAAAVFEPGTVQPQRVAAIARRLRQHHLGRQIRGELPPCRVEVEAVAPPHSGLGSGTQLALATALGLATHFGLALSRRQLVETLAERGRRSAIGSFGFFEGGLIAEDGQAGDYQAAGNWRRVEPPPAWRVVLARPQGWGSPVSGEAETEAFAALQPAPRRLREQLQRLGSDLVAAVAQADFDAFTAALTPFNRTSGELFASQQGGCYNGAAVTRLVHQIAAAGGQGYGQSSWGPSVFAFCRSAAAAQQLAGQLGSQVVTIARPRCRGATLEVLDDQQP